MDGTERIVLAAVSGSVYILFMTNTNETGSYGFQIRNEDGSYSEYTACKDRAHAEQIVSLIPNAEGRQVVWHNQRRRLATLDGRLVKGLVG